MAAFALAAGTLTSAGDTTVENRPQTQTHWAFRPVSGAAVPAIPESGSAVDAFLEARLAKAGVPPAAEADRGVLLRRVTFDLVGLPPSPGEFDEFLADDLPDAFERQVDRLLASPQHGEAWGRLWLDVVRYSETAGFNADPTRPLAYKYRDYVIDALNADVPYDRFIAEQIAGDELWPERADAVIATGYLLLWPDESNASNVFLARQESLNDVTANVGTAFLGLSFGCAQCHDHKFDPISLEDFYSLQAFFAGVVRGASAPIATTSELADYQDRLTRWLAETASLREELHAIEQHARAKAGAYKRMKFPPVVLAAIDTDPVSRTAMQRQLAFFSERQIEITDKQFDAQLTEQEKGRRADLRTQVASLEAKRPSPPASIEGMVAREVAIDAPATHLLYGGSYTDPDDAELAPALPASLTDASRRRPAITPPRADTSGRRTALARWLGSGASPLPARVIVNRVWQEHFGRGLVSNANDFGTRTPEPVHLDLLDCLSADFTASGWSLKDLHRTIVTSDAYRRETPRDSAVDGDDESYTHYPRRRLSAERLRDAILAVSGRLNVAMRGPSVRPELPPGFNTREKWEVSPNVIDRDRRSVYIFAKRNLPYPLLDTFDLPNMFESCGRRAETTIAPQALMLLNSEMILGYAHDFARLLIAEHGDVAEGIVQGAYRAAYGRSPDDEELAGGVAFVARQRSRIADDPQPEGSGAAQGLVTEGGPKTAQGVDPAFEGAVADLCHALFNSNEFLFGD